MMVIKFRELVDGEYKKDVSEECGVKRPPKQRERLESAQLGEKPSPNKIWSTQGETWVDRKDLISWVRK